MPGPTLSPIAQAWRDKGKRLDVPDGNPGTWIWREGSGPAVVCIHGVPASSFLYRKMLPEIAARGLEGIAFDLPGLGFADRPANFNYSWPSLGEWFVKALNAAEIDKFHLVVHDIGGPIGFDVIQRIPDRVLSLTVLNTLTYTEGFIKPWIMRFFEYRGLGSIAVKTMSSAIVVPIMRIKGVMSTPTNLELKAYGEMLVLGDGGSAFLKIMRSFDTSKEFQERNHAALRARKFPAQIIFGEYDAELNHKQHATQACEVLRIPKYFLVPGKHFIQEDCYVDLAEHVSELVKLGKDRMPS